MKPLQNAQDLWNQPDKLIELWERDEDKHENENIVARFVASVPYKVSKVADLGCGVGRYAEVLPYDEYFGFDASTAMIREAKKEFEGYNEVQFSVVDIFNFVSDDAYDALILIDVAYHMDNPAEAVRTILRNWDADRYFFTLLVGPEHEDLYSSTVITYDEYFDLLEDLGGLKYGKSAIKRSGGEKFVWMLTEVVS